MGTRVKGKVALVTGATRGIGEGLARGLAAEGAAVIVSGIEQNDGQRIADEIGQMGGQARFVFADVRNAADCARAVESTVNHFGRLDVLVNNAGIFPSLSLEETTPEIWDEVFAVNVRGAFLCAQAAIPIMQRQRGGSIINIGSTLPYQSQNDRFAYAASKGALLTLTRSLAQAYARDRIRANWITVGWVASPGEIALRDALYGDGRAFLEERARQMPLGRMETVEDIAAGVLYLASDEASHVTGCELNISGGLWI